MTAKPKQRKYWRESDARAFVEAHAASGLTVAAFAHERGIPAQRLKWWRRRLGIRSEMGASERRTATGFAAPPAVRLARVERAAPAAVAALPRGAVLTIEVGRARVEVPAGFDAGTVRAVLDAVVLATSGGGR